MITEISIQKVSSKVFSDLGYDDPEEISAKSKTVRNISNTITELQIDTYYQMFQSLGAGYSNYTAGEAEAKNG